jgi:hypothetical protein
VVGPGRAQLAAAVGSSSVVVGFVSGQDRPQVSLAEDEYLAGDLVRAVRTNRSAQAFARGLRGGIFTASMPVLARTVSKDWVNCPARSRSRNRKSAVRSRRFIMRLRICCVVHGPFGWAVTLRMWM